jgi:hypothetical protein
MNSASVNSSPSVYVLCGTPGSGRAEILVDLLESLLDGGESVAVLQPDDCDVAPNQLHSEHKPALIRYQLNDCQLHLPAEETIDDAVVLIVAPGLAHPGDMAEAVKAWLAQSGRSLARILTIVDCAKAAEHGRLRTWLEAWIHFSDAVLLNHRESVSQKWIQEFEKHFHKLCYPCRFFNVKKGRLRNPAEALEPEPRRISLYFDELEPIEEDDMDDEERPGDLAEDPYVARLESGQRAKPLPPIDKLFA